MRQYVKPILSFLLLFSSAAALANCPPSNHVVLKCGSMTGNIGSRICVWSSTDGWYEGSNPVIPTKPGETADRFVKAIWFPYKHAMLGATDCIYSDSHGAKITLFQQSHYGMVPRPEGYNWSAEAIPEFRHAMVCTTSPERCNFHYAN